MVERPKILTHQFPVAKSVAQKKVWVLIVKQQKLCDMTQKILDTKHRTEFPAQFPAHGKHYFKEICPSFLCF